MSGLFLPVHATGKAANYHAADYVRRKGWVLEEAERWLAPVLGY